MKKLWWLCAILVASPCLADKFYITMPDDNGGPAAAEVVYGENRVDAVGHSAITVWTEEEWKSCVSCQHFHPKFAYTSKEILTGDSEKRVPSKATFDYKAACGMDDCGKEP